MTRVLFWLVIVAAYFLFIIFICKCISFARKKYVRSIRPAGGRQWANRAIQEPADLPESADDAVGPVLLDSHGKPLAL